LEPKLQERNIRKLTLFGLTWPIFIELLLHMLMGNVDTFMLSQYSDQAVAAVGVANQMLNMINIMFNFVAAGTAVLVAQHIGAGRFDQANRVAGTSIVLNIGIGVVLSGVIVLISEPALRLIGIEEGLMPEARSYLTIIGSFMFLEALLLTVSAVLKSHGFTRDTMYITIGMNIINVIGNYICIFGPFGLPVFGVPGVACVTVITRTVALVVMSLLLFRKVKLPLARDIFRPLKEHIVGLLKIGVPSAGENLSYNISQLVVTSFIAMIGTTALVTRIYSMNLMYYIMLLSIAVGQGTQILVARMIGAGEIHQAYKRGLHSLYIGMSSSFVMAIVFNLTGKPLLGLFTDDPAVISLGMTLLTLSLILEPGRAFNIILISALRAAGDVQFPVYMAILSMWGICVPVSYLLGIHFDMGLVGVFIAFILDEWVRGLCMLWRWRRRGWQNHATIQAVRRSGSSSAEA